MVLWFHPYLALMRRVDELRMASAQKYIDLTAGRATLPSIQSFAEDNKKSLRYYGVFRWKRRVALADPYALGTKNVYPPFI